jgi:uroporphyrinogen III methyltransferase/synthase
LFTSPNSVQHLWRRIDTLELDARAFGTARLGAIGPATARALEVYGLRADFVASPHTSEAILAQLELSVGDRILLPRSDIAPPLLPDGLRSRGALVDEVIAYRTTQPAPDPQALGQLRDGQIDLVTFTSASTVANLAAAVAPDPLSAILRGAAVACIGPVTAEAVRSLGGQVDLVATPHTVDGLMKALAAADWAWTAGSRGSVGA